MTKKGKGNASKKWHFTITAFSCIVLISCVFISYVLYPKNGYILIPILILIGCSVLMFLILSGIAHIYLIFGRKSGEKQSIEKSLVRMIKSFSPEALGDRNVIIQYNFTGFAGEKWYVSIENKKCNLKKGFNPDYNVMLSMKPKVWFMIAQRKMSGELAVMSGLLKVKGDRELLMYHEHIFNVKELDEGTEKI